MQRIWKRNLGRDDRCISDHGKEVWLILEPFFLTIQLKHFSSTVIISQFMSFSLFSKLQARFPFLDEDVIRILLEIPLWEIADLDEPAGRGDKKILREVNLSAYFFTLRLIYDRFQTIIGYSRLLERYILLRPNPLIPNNNTACQSIMMFSRAQLNTTYSHSSHQKM